MTLGRASVLLVAFAAFAVVSSRPLQAPELVTEGRALQAEDGVVLSLDAAASEVGPALLGLANGAGDATWSNPADPALALDLHNAGYNEAFGGAVVFTAPSDGSSAPGTYGDGQPAGVQDGAWGDEFTGLVWLKPGQLGGSDAVLAQVLGVDELGDAQPSATWRVASFQDQTSGSIAIKGFQARASYSPDSLRDCWVQLAVVKSGPGLQFYQDKLPAGTATAAYVVNDYAADVLAVGVDYSGLAQPGSNATDINPSTAAGPLGWLSGSMGAIELYSRALTADEIAAKYDAQSQRFAEALCSTQAPAAAAPQPADASPLPQPGVPSGAPSSPSTPQGPSPSPGSSPSGVNPPVITPSVPSLSPSPSPSAPAEPPKAPSTLDNSTATVAGSGESGTVTNALTITGGQELATLDSDPAKQQQLKEAILASLNLPPGYTADNIQLNVVSVTQQGTRRLLQVPVFKVVVEYTLAATPQVPVEQLQQAEVNVYLFIRVQQPVIPWWSGPTATICVSNTEGACNPATPPISPPVVNPGCSANVCFLLDGSKSLFNVDAWNDVVAAARSIMYSISDPAAMFDVFWFSNDVNKIGQATGAEVAANNTFTSKVVNTLPNAHGTFMAQAIQTCQNVLLNEDSQTSRTIVLITDGKPTDPAPTFAAADSAKQLGIKMVVVGAGEIDYTTLKQLASGPSFVFANSNLDSSQLQLMADLASQGVCRELD